MLFLYNRFLSLNSRGYFVSNNFQFEKKSEKNISPVLPLSFSLDKKALPPTPLEKQNESDNRTWLVLGPSNTGRPSWYCTWPGCFQKVDIFQKIWKNPFTAGTDTQLKTIR